VVEVLEHCRVSANLLRELAEVTVVAGIGDTVEDLVVTRGKLFAAADDAAKSITATTTSDVRLTGSTAWGSP
jgi:hypothetical protein